MSAPDVELTMPFGLHCGCTIESIPNSYLQWMIDNLDEGKYNNADLIASAETELAYRKDHGVYIE